MSVEVADVLEKAAEIIERRGWTQGSFIRADGSCCIVGALDIASGGINYNRPAYKAVQRVVLVDVLSQWNDEKGRTQAEVITALRNAAAAERAS